MLHCELEIVQTTTFDALEEAKFLSDIRQRIKDIKLLLFVFDSNLKTFCFALLGSSQGLDRRISSSGIRRMMAPMGIDRNPEEDGISPLLASQSSDTERPCHQ